MTSLADLTRGPERVFPTHARVERYYPAAAAEEARGVLKRCIERGEGPSLLIGSPGTGKSMLLQVVAHDVAASRPVACLTSAQLCTRRALLQSILFELDQPFRQRDEGELRLELIDYLQSANVGEKGVVLLVDEAQSLPTRLLEELRVLSNLAHQGDPRLHLVLAGSQSLDEKFTAPELEAFNQRIAARCYLSPFNHHDTVQYVRGHLAAARANPDELFSADALSAIYEATGGIARLVNQLCDRALLVAARRQALRINRDLVQTAWADLQQLPTPWNLPDTPERLGERDLPRVEYGPLTREPVEGDLDYDGTELDESFDALDLGGENDPFGDMGHPVRPSFTPARVFAPSDDDLDLAELEEETEVASYEPAAAENYGPVESTDTRSSDDTEPEPRVTNPFDESFDDEEIVIDPFANLQSVVSSGGKPVTNTFEREISGLLHQVARYEAPATAAEGGGLFPTEPEESQGVPPFKAEPELTSSFTIVEAFEGVRNSAEEKGKQEVPTRDFRTKEVTPYNRPASGTAKRSDESGEPSRSGCPSGPELLVVDDEGTLGENPAIAFPTDYRHLFASLRRD